MVKPGQIIDIYFPFKPPILPGQASGKYRPALIMSVADDGTAIAVAVKITSSEPTARFPDRIEIVHWQEAGLDNESYAEVESEIAITVSGPITLRGELNPVDFNSILLEYHKFKRKRVIRNLHRRGPRK
ncbi:hypothetical protein JOC78_001637 [Bacillus ectoiniformans]|uniref:hypothetical protein n=1 Tax=Bacillus ectoiniformans TaxID=1494429 RepID=UPI001958BDD3|nr:hypothetical protein [Bacillus ectoiniformans]MBM7648691.1 hypothetical protein [Bacillus ectoiniformans]